MLFHATPTLENTIGKTRMSNNPLIPESKLPALGTTIFTQMSALAIFGNQDA
jgi:hypothetical protein